MGLSASRLATRQGFSRWGKGFILALFAVVLYGVWSGSERAGIDKLRGNGGHRLDLYAASLDAELRKYDYLPTLLSLNPDVIALLREPHAKQLQDSVNHYLESVNAQAGSNAIYVLDLKGTAIAASNWKEEASFVGQNLSYRPYFQDALKQGRGRFYGIGTTSGKPGYYFSYGIRSEDRLLGVAALKVSLDQLEQAWATGAEIVLVVDANGVIFLSSVSAWKFRTLGTVAPEIARQIQATRQYEGVTLLPLEMVETAGVGDGARIVKVRDNASPSVPQGGAEHEYLAQSRTMTGSDWQLILLSDLNPVRTLSRNMAGLAFAFLALLFLYLHQRRRTIAQTLAARETLQRAHDELERKVSERTADLVAANERLQREIAERKRAEQVLREAQDELVQAGKMAVLGQMSAGITHELNQPLAALHTLSDNARVLLERNRPADVHKNLAKISQLVERMGGITGQLKTFARKSTTRLVPVAVKRAVSNALFLVERRLRLEDIRLEQDIPGEEINALCNGNRLEQVLVNLFANAIDAMKGCPERRLQITANRTADKVLIRVRDTGTGIAPELLPRLFEPFCTTKEAGAGLGLGLAISAGIVREFGGTLKAANRAEGGAEFVIELQGVPAEAIHE